MSPLRPPLSVEDRERLERIATFCDEHWDRVAKADAAFLRHLASAPPEGHACDPEHPCEPNDHICRNARPSAPPAGDGRDLILVCGCGTWEPVDPGEEREPGLIRVEENGEQAEHLAGCPQCGSTERTVWVSADVAPSTQPNNEQRYREALELIATCERRAPGDVVDIARAALKEETP
jgi:hypothetical protein